MFNPLKIWTRMANAGRRAIASCLLGPVARAADLRLDRDALMTLTAREQARAPTDSATKTRAKLDQLRLTPLTVIEGGRASRKCIARSTAPEQRHKRSLTGIPGGLEKAS